MFLMLKSPLVLHLLCIVWVCDAFEAVTVTQGASTPVYYASTSPIDDMDAIDLTQTFGMPPNWDSDEQAMKDSLFSNVLTRSSGDLHASGRRLLQGYTPNLIYRGGVILPKAIVKAIFWGPKWLSSSFMRDKLEGINNFYEGWSGSNYARTQIEFYDTKNGHVTDQIKYDGYVINPSKVIGLESTSMLVAKVCESIKDPDPSGNAYYAMYLDIPRGNTNFCGWHGSGYCSGIRVQFGIMLNLDGDAMCDVRDAVTGNSQGLASLINISAHELAEAITNPTVPYAWYGEDLNENADKCAWMYNGRAYIKLANGRRWKIQGEWSNEAYNTQRGFGPQRGCVDGF